MADDTDLLTDEPQDVPDTEHPTDPEPEVTTETTGDDADADKALATYYETGHVPAGWVYSRGEMHKRTDG